MNVLAVALCAPPKNSPESIQVGRYLAALSGQGAEVTLLTTTGERASWSPDDSSLQAYLTPLHRVRAVPIPEKRWFSALGRRLAPPLLDLPDDDALLLLRFPWLLRGLPRPDVVYSRSLPHTSTLLGGLIASHFRVPWVMHLSDPWVGNPFHQHPFPGLHRRLEAACLERASLISFTCEEALDHYARRYPRLAMKFMVSPNVYDEQPPAPAPPALPIRIVHTGRFYGARRPDGLLRALAGMRDEALAGGLVVEFAGNAPPEVHARMRELGPLVVDRGPVSYEEAREMQRRASVLLAIDAPAEDDRFLLFFPSKMLDYMASGALLLSLTPAGSPTERVTREAGGLSCEPGDEAAIQRLLREVLRRGAAGLLSAPRCPPPLRYSAAHAASELLVQMGRLVPGGAC
ncbi:MAG: glycosyltransferase [Polyangiaceae bacterium]|jgi:hypothetical protein|nr:glycosyltransferase [Polyangiaceae bacterium]